MKPPSFKNSYHVYILCICVGVGYVHVNGNDPGGQKRLFNPLGLSLQVVGAVLCGCWDLNLGPLEELSLSHLTQVTVK